MNHVRLQTDDIQGLLASGYARQSHSVFLVLKFTDPAGARRWLAQVIPQVTSARKPTRHVDSTLHTSLNLAFTFAGLHALGLGDEALATFPTEFQLGMQERKRILGDTGLSAPEQWDDSFRDPDSVHALLLLYAGSETALESFQKAQASAFSDHGIECRATLPTSVHSHEHFGFKDGISQPSINGLTHGLGQDVLEPGEFIMGYPNHAGELPISPTVPAEQDENQDLPSSNQLGNTQARDLGANGTYLIFRKLYQDVGFFRQSIENLAAQIPPDMVPVGLKASEWLAAKIVGRFPNGSPLALSDQNDRLSDTPNSFGYAQTDPDGLKCPFGAHVRRSNPRDALPSAGKDSKEIVNNHRLLRRGRSYGPPFDSSSPNDDRGLYFMALCSNICRQFEFVQQTWINSPKFGGLFDNVDCLSGNNPDPAHWKPRLGGAATPKSVPPDEDTNIMTIPASPARMRVCGFERFVRVQGGAYFFMPGIRALTFLSHLR